MQFHEEIIWNLKRSAAEKGENIDENINKLSYQAWFEAIKKKTGRSIKIVKK